MLLAAKWCTVGLCRYVHSSVYLAPGVGVVVPVGIGGIGSTVVAEHCGKEHHDNQDGIGDGKYQHKDETDDAELFGFLYFVFLLLVEGLRGWGEGERRKERVCACVYSGYVCVRY